MFFVRFFESDHKFPPTHCEDEAELLEFLLLFVDDWFVTRFPEVRLATVPAEVVVTAAVPGVISPGVSAVQTLLQGRATLGEMKTSGDHASRAEEVCRGIEARVPGKDEDRQASLSQPERVDADLDGDGTLTFLLNTT